MSGQDVPTFFLHHINYTTAFRRTDATAYDNILFYQNLTQKAQ